MAAIKIFNRFRELIDVNWAAISDGQLIKRSGTSIIGADGVGIALWDSITEYTASSIVIDREGVWKATGTNSNSRPVCGNTDWELVGGVAYLDTIIQADQIIAFPFYDPSFLGPGVMAVPAPGEDKLVYPLSLQLQTTDGDNWAQAAGLYITYGDQNGDEIAMNVNDDLLESGGWYHYANFIQSTNSDAPNNKPIIISALNDASNGGIQVGTRSLIVRFHYVITDIVNYEAFGIPTFYHIIGIDQGTNTITVNGDDSAITGAIEVVGSTGDDGTYTIVSATFDTDHTDIVVSESIPNPTADGWVKQ